MLSPLKPLLCRHDYYWSERHLSERCRRCGKRRTAESVTTVNGGTSVAVGGVAELDVSLRPPGDFASAFLDLDDRRSQPLRSPATFRPNAQVLKAQARERREMLLDSLDQLARGERLTRDEAIDTVLAVIEDAHSADPVLFGADAAGHFARLHEARLARSEPRQDAA